jgi:hypothetical protein
MFCRIGGLLVFWIWHTEQLNAWGFAPTRGKAEARAKARILARRPDLAQAKLEQVRA